MNTPSRVAVVTGGARGIGRAISRQLAKQGCKVVIATRTLEPATKVVDEIERAGGQAFAMALDVSDRKQVERVFGDILGQFGRIEVLVNNAGGSARGDMSLFRHADAEVWERIFATNLMGVLYTCRQAINPMLNQQFGRIINIASVAGMIGTAGQADYSAAKGGVIAFSAALAKETAGKGVTVNCVSPGPTVSEAAREMTPESMRNTPYEGLARSTGFNRFGEADDVANIVSFLASDKADFITGQNHPVCGVMNLGIVDQLGGQRD